MCTAFLAAANRDWNEGAQAGKEGMEKKWEKKSF